MMINKKTLQRMHDPELFYELPSPLTVAQFLRRPQRFLAEMRLPTSEIILSYCSNPGSLKGCLQENSPALLWLDSNPKRKRKYTWKAIQLNGIWVGTDTHITNRLIKHALEKNLLFIFEDYNIQSEVKIDDDVRIDFLLTRENEKIFIEVKSSTIAQGGIATFPDSISPRSLKHLNALIQKVKNGDRAAMIFVAQREDVNAFQISRYDPAYTLAIQNALISGVEIYAISFPLSLGGFARPRWLKVNLE